MSHPSPGAGKSRPAPPRIDEMALAIRFTPEMHYWVTRDRATAYETVHYPSREDP